MARDLNLAMIMRADTGQARRALGDLRRSFREMGTGASDATDVAAAGMRVLTAAAIRAGSAIGAALSVRALARTADAWSDMQSRVGSVMHDMSGAPDMMQRLLDIANRTYSGLAQTVDIYALNSVTLQAMGRSAQDAADFTASLNDMLVVNATKGEEARIVTDALSRAIANGKLDALGFQAIMSRNPRVLQAVADKMRINVNALREMASQGEVTGDVIVDAVIGALAKARAEAEAMPATIGDGFLKIGNSATALIGVIDQALGLSHGIAEWLDGISKSIAALAAADFSGLADGMALAAGLLGDALLVLAATRIPAVIGALAAMNISTLAYTAGMRAGAIATTLMATASRGLGAALAFMGGPLGLAAGLLAAVGIAIATTSREAAGMPSRISRIAEAQRDLTSALAEYSQTNSVVALKDAEASAIRQRALIEEEIVRLKAREGALRDTLGQSGMSGKAAAASDNAVRASIARTNSALDELYARLQRVGERQVQISADIARLSEEAGGDVTKMTDAQLKAAEAARAQVVQLRAQADINAVIARYGADSLVVTLARHAAERRLFVAQTEAKDLTRQMKDELVAAWDAANGMARADISSGLYRAAGAAEALYRRLGDALGAVRGIVNEVGRIGFDTIAVKAETAALRAGKSAAEARLEGTLAQDRAQMAANGLPDWANTVLLKGKEMAGRELIQAQAERDAELARRSGSGPGGGGGGSPEAERNAIQDLIAEQQRQIAVLRETDPVQREIMANHEALARASAAEAGELRSLIAERQRLETIQSITDEIGASGRAAFTDLAKGAASLTDALASVLDKLADIAASTVWDMFWNGTGGSRGLSGFFSDLVGRTLGGAPAKAGGGMVTGPGGPREDNLLHWLSAGEYVVNAVATRANLPLLEAMNAGIPAMDLLKRIAHAPRLASGGMVGMVPPARPAGGAVTVPATARAAPVVNIINRSPEPIREEGRSGPDLEGTVTLVVGRAEARGKFDRTRRGRFGLTPEVSRR